MDRNNIYFKLYPNFIPVKGKYKCILADINNGEYFEIPELVFEILHINELNNYNLNQLNNFFDNKYKSGIKGYFDMFVKKRIGFYLDTNTSIIKISYEYKFPFKASNAVIEIENKENYCISTLIKDLIRLGCHEIEIRILRYEVLLGVLEILKKFQTSMVRSFYLVCLCGIGNERLDIKDELERNLKIRQLKIFNSKNNHKEQKDKITHISQPYAEDFGYSSIIINPIYFFESQKLNASLNQKIVVDKNGDIKNYLTHQKKFGNINTSIIEDVIENTDFTKMWNIPNDDIEICKECQYRYFCLNFSEIKEKKGRYYRKNYCKELYLN